MKMQLRRVNKSLVARMRKSRNACGKFKRVGTVLHRSGFITFLIIQQDNLVIRCVMSKFCLI